MELKENDILIFKSGKKMTYTKMDKWVIDHFYNENLENKKNDDYTIVDALRAYYYSVKDEKSIFDVSNMSIDELREELKKKRLEINSLKQEIKQKDETIKKYSDYFNKQMEIEYSRRLNDGENRDASTRQRVIKKDN